MSSHFRKFLLQNNTTKDVVNTTNNHHSSNNNHNHGLTSSSSSSSSLSSVGEQRERNSHEAGGSYSATCCYNSFKLTPPFDSAMALTVLVLLTALFFMGFFSIYIRRFADENAVDPTRRRRRRREAAAVAGEAAGYLTRVESGGKGVDAAVVGSLPVYVYRGGDVEEGVVFSKVEERECAICLSEFEEREWVKEIPYCGHVFHVECIDTWLKSHVTCPLCRTADFFPAVVEKEDNKNNTATAKKMAVDGHVEGEEVGGSSVEEVGDVGESVEDNGGGERDTWREAEREAGPGNVRRTSSCSWFGERVTLQRSLSF